MPDALPRDLRVALVSLQLRRRDLPFDVRWHEALPSTMDAVATAGASGAPAGYVAIADQQTAGRGRRGHAWCSPAGAGLYFSYLARPTRHVELMTLAAGVGVLRGLRRSTGVAAHLKWPNDLLVGSRKLAGLLAEGHHLGLPDAWVTIGVGINISPAAYPADVAARAIDLKTACGREVSRFELFATVLESLGDALRLLEQGQPGDILREWRVSAPSSNGTTVTWLDNGVRRQGTTAGIDDTGALLVLTGDGLERVIAGELDWQFPASSTAASSPARPRS